MTATQTTPATAPSRPYGLAVKANAWQRLLPRIIVVLAVWVPVSWFALRILAGLTGWLTFTVLYYVTIPSIVAMLVLAWLIRGRATIVSPRAAGAWTSWLFAVFLVFAVAWPWFFGEAGQSGPLRHAPVRNWIAMTEAEARGIGGALVYACLAAGSLSLLAAIVEYWVARREFYRPRDRRAR
ncbi:hypothetical protein [Aestuariimicrobium ganziense]|uniref:hypothetical protein n=1 Tax=Aestuariimicrobium ganziense TaxID=2773677 RepID=UPI001940C2C4|nr:hypothetical protein [Aestuariimicrobium ganziense]